MNYHELINRALEAREQSYCPYSDYSVGAALLCADGEVYSGCNIENSSFTPTICAERVALYKAITEGRRDFAAMAIVGGNRSETLPKDYAMPCGVCRQTLSEFVHKDFKIIVAKSKDDYKVFDCEDLFPMGFTFKRLD